MTSKSNHSDDRDGAEPGQMAGRVRDPSTASAAACVRARAGTHALRGGTWPRYLVWHPLDHIGYQVLRPAATGRVGPGAGLRITEALGRDLSNLLDIHVRVEELADGRAVIAKRVLGTTLVRLENEFTDSPDGRPTCRG